MESKKEECEQLSKFVAAFNVKFPVYLLFDDRNSTLHSDLVNDDVYGIPVLGFAMDDEGYFWPIATETDDNGVSHIVSEDPHSALWIPPNTVVEAKRLSELKNFWGG